MAPDNKPEADRGWAWVVLISGLVIFGVNSLTMNMYGVLYIALLDTYKAGESKTALVGALNNGFLCFFTPVSTSLLNRFGSRRTALAGVVTTAAGFALSAVVPSLDGIIVTSGVAVGIGYSMMNSSTVVSIGFYFKKYRNMGMASMYFAVGMGMFGSTPLGLLLLENVGLPSTFLILSCLTLQFSCIGVMLARPSTLELDSQRVRRRNQTKLMCVTSVINVHHLKNTGFVLYLFSIISWNFAFGVVAQHLPNYLAVNGATNERISLVFLVFAISNTAGRLCGTLLSGRIALNHLLVNALTMALSGIGTVTFFYYSDFQYGSEIFAVQLGFLVGIPNCTQLAVAVRFIELAELPDAVSFVYFFSGIGVFLGPYVAGIIYSVTKSYGYSFITAGAVLIIGCGCACVSDIISRKPQPLKEVPNDSLAKDEVAMLTLAERQAS